MLGAMEAQDAAVIIGACAAFVVAILGALLKVVSEIRKQTSDTNRAVNDRPRSDPTLRELVELIDKRVTELSAATIRRHDINTNRIERVSIAVEAQTRKMDRLSNAIAGVNDRIERIESTRQEERREDHHENE